MRSTCPVTFVIHGNYTIIHPKKSTRWAKTGKAPLPGSGRGEQLAKKAFPSLPSADGKPNSIIFCQGVYLAKNTLQAESVRAVRLRRTASARFSLRSPPNGSPAKRVPFGAPAWRRPPCRLVFIVLHSPCRSSRWIRGPTGRRIPPWSPGPRPCCRSTDSPRSRCLRRGPSERGGRRRSPCR